MTLKKTLPLILLSLISTNLQARETVYVIFEPHIVLREEDTVNSKPLGYVPFGTKLEVLWTNSKAEFVLGVSSLWRKVEYEGKVGWVFLPLTSPNRNDRAKMMQDEIVPGYYAFNEDPELLHGFPLPTKHCQSLHHYIHTSFSAQAPGRYSSNPATYEDTIQRDYSQNFTYQIYSYLEGTIHTVTFPPEAKPLIPYIINRCTPVRAPSSIAVPGQACKRVSERDIHVVDIIAEKDGRISVSYQFTGTAFKLPCEK